ncbi:MAG: hypothetical protein AAGI46_09120 [Planctomycetota bacterium]
MWIRLLRDRGKEEWLVNLDHVSAIEVLYHEAGADGSKWLTDPIDARESPEARRAFRFRVAGMSDPVVINADDPAAKPIEDLYNRTPKS